MNFDNQTMWNKDGTTGEFTGVKGGSGTTKAFFAGANDKDGTDAKFYAQADGNIFHNAIRQQLYVKEDIAGFNIGDSLNVSGPALNKWKTRAVSSGTANDTVEDIKIQRQFVRKFGEDYLRLEGQLEHDRNTDGATVDGHAKVTLRILGESAEDTFQTSSIGTESFSLVVGLDGFLSLGDPFYAEVRLEAHVNGLDSGATSNTAFAYLLDNINFFISTRES